MPGEICSFSSVHARKEKTEFLISYIAISQIVSSEKLFDVVNIWYGSNVKILYV